MVLQNIFNANGMLFTTFSVIFSFNIFLNDIPICFRNEPGHEKMCLMSYANNKGADQPAHPRSVISVFIVRC